MKEIATYAEKEGYPLNIVSVDFSDNYLECADSNGLKLRVYLIDEKIFRFRFAVEGFFENDFSYAIDPKFEKKDVKSDLEENDDHIILKTSAVVCKIDKASFKITMLNHQGDIISQDEKGFHWEKSEYGGYIVQMTKKIDISEAFYGLGDKPIELNIRGHRFQNWGTDEYGYAKGTDPLYKNIPFYYGLRNGIGYGVFFDNTFKAFFDFGRERRDVMSFWAQGGEMNYYFIAGPQLLDVCKSYTKLTGTPDMPPMWALGFQQCKWSYYPESNVKEVTSKMRELQIPCDAIYLDIDYMEGFRCFTWDEKHFPDPKRMVDELKADGFKTMVIIDPGIKKDKNYDIFNEGLEKGYFCKRVDGPYVEGKVWPGECYFPDFTRPEVREWWAGLYKELIQDVGVAGVWNDMNEPALFEVESKTFPLDVVHDYDGNTTSHRKAHNVYGMQMARATADGVKRFRDGQRTLIITRSGYSGLQRFSSVWTGDNIASWEHLWLADVQAQRLAVSGISFCGSDIGGFINSPSSELMIRWIQLGIFHPFCRVHSSGDHGDQEPWSFGEECTDMFRRFVEIRYQLIGYLYSAFYDYHKTGNPMLKPVVFFNQEDIQTINIDHEFLCGDKLLVCPIVRPGVQEREMYFPKGRWYSYWDDTVYEGNRRTTVPAPLDQIPLFVKEGSIVPMYPIQQYIGEKEIQNITLNIYFKEGKEESQFFNDDLNTFEYERGDYRLATFELTGKQNAIDITQLLEGDYYTEIKTYTLKVIGFECNNVIVDGEKIELNKNKEFVITSGFNHLQLTK